MNAKVEYQRPETILIELECEAMIAGSGSLTNNSGKDFGGIKTRNTGLSGSLSINLSDEE